MKIPDIDRAIGIEVYSTDIEGIQGSIRQSGDQFVVEELLDNVSLDLVKEADDQHEYPLYILRKEGIDTSHAAREVEISTGLKFKTVGLKDAKAITTQYASSVRKERNAGECIVTKHCKLDLVGYTGKPITKGKLVGNRFAIIVTDFIDENVEQKLARFKEAIDAKHIANFYGYQRFGSSRAVTHLVGREIIKRNFRKAVELFLCYPGINSSKEMVEIREACKDEANFSKVLEIMPLQMDLERLLLQELIKSNDPLRAIRKLPINIRRLFVQAYQSYLFNKSLSMIVSEGYDTGRARDGDICSCFVNNNLIGVNKFDESKSSVIQLPAIPLVGYTFRDNNRFSSIVKKVMEEDNLSKNDFYVMEMQEVSAEGGFRPASLLCNEFSYELNDTLNLQFSLFKGCYATTLLREIMKPSNPIASGF
jgi:tRNA pseudouridine13 synthase